MVVKKTGLVVMVLSNILSWLAVSNSAASGNMSSLTSTVWKVALCYLFTLWALFNKFFGVRPERPSHASLGILSLSFLCGTARTFPLPASCGLVGLNFFLVFPIIAQSKGPAGFSKRLWRDTSTLAVLWGYMFTVYALSNVGLWSYVVYEFRQLAGMTTIL